MPSDPVLPVSRVAPSGPLPDFTGTGKDVAVARWGVIEMKKRSMPTGDATKEGVKHLAAVETNVFHKLPALVAHCCVTRYDDGEPRRPGWFTIKTMGSAWIVQVKEPDACLQLQATAQTLDDALALADLLVGSEEAPWEPDPFLRQQSARAKK